MAKWRRVLPAACQPAPFFTFRLGRGLSRRACLSRLVNQRAIV